MRHALKLHPDSSCPAVASIEVEVIRPSARALVLTYLVTGDIGRLRLPPQAASVRTDGLWRHTCFEVFVRAPGAAGYCEFNLAPSTQWAAYGFTGYRDGMTALDLPAPPRIEARADAESLVLHAALDLDPTRGPADDGLWRLGLSAVIEDADGAVAYWALAHPPGTADFHHPDCFALEVVAPGRS